MEFWLTVLIALPGAVVNALHIYNWYRTQRKKSSD
jgi:hypothetical protein